MKLLLAILFFLGFSGSVESRPKPDQIQILIQEQSGYGRGAMSAAFGRGAMSAGYGRGPDYISGEMATVGRFVCYLTEDLGNTIF
jgi:hypothetical protein